MASGEYGEGGISPDLQEDDVAHTGIAMGTPGDKANFGKVVRGEQQSQLDPEQPQQGITTTTTTTTTTTSVTTTTTLPSSTATTQAIIQPAPSSSVVHHLPFQPQPSTSSEMGLLSRLPQFEAFTTARPAMPPSAAAVKPEPPSSESFLGQAHMEDYYAHAKYYQPAISETLQTLYPTLPSTSKSRRLDEPGPSGLQPTASKATASTSAGAAATAAAAAAAAAVPQTKSGRGGSKRTSTRSRGAAAGPSTSSAVASTSTGKKGSTACPVCHKNFANAEKLTKHQQVHSQGAASAFKCEHCKKSFSSKFKLVRHALIHSDRKPFSCTVCERTFHRKDHLKNHIKVHSPSKKIYVCERPDCKKEYTSQMSYRKHQALHSAEEGSLQCQICSGTFSTKEEILYHLKVHAGSRTVKNPNEKKFTCDQCDRKFFTKKDVRRHLVVHTGMRDFLCQFCPQRFGRKDHLVRHIKKSHSKNVTVEEIETAIKTEAAAGGLVMVPAAAATAAAGVSGLVGPGPGAGPGGGIRRSSGLPETVVKPEQQEQLETMSSVKTELGEFSEAAPEEQQFGWGSLEDVLETGSFAEIALDPESFLPSTSGQAELKDLGSAILEDIEETEAPMVIGELDPELQVNPELQRLLEPSEEKNLPLPGFSQTFQSPPPPP